MKTTYCNEADQNNKHISTKDMSNIEQDDKIDKCNFCGATYDDEITKALIEGQDGTMICNACIE